MQPQNLYQLLQGTAAIHPGKSLVFYKPGEIGTVWDTLKYPDLLQRAVYNARRIHQLGLKPGSIILLHFNNHLDNALWFWSTICAGYVPAMSTPFSNNLEQRKKHIVYLDSLLDKPLCLTQKELLPEFAGRNTFHLKTIDGLPLPSEVTNNFMQRDGIVFPVDQGRFKQSDELAALMLTSGSTGNAKAVCLTHTQILTSIADKARIYGTNAQHSFLNWIGFDHVACLTELHLHAMWVGGSQIHVQAADLVPNPLHFLELIHKHHVAYAFAPNFFLASLQRAMEALAAKQSTIKLDLSRLRCIVTGGEANVVEMCVALTKLLERLGAPSNVLNPAFGMTETCAGSIYSKDCPRRDVEHGNIFATVGVPIPGMEMRITNEEGKDVGTDVPGNLEVKGPVVLERYYNNQQATEESFNNGWFITGDQGVIDSSSQLDLTSRKKDTLIINGINYLPQEIETALEDVPGTKPSYTVVFPYRPKNSQTECLCVAYCPTFNLEDIEARVATSDAISKVAMLQTGSRPLILPLDETLLQKTSLGKLSRPKIRTAFEKGDYGANQKFNDEAIADYKANTYEGPVNASEQVILGVFRDVFDAATAELGVNVNIFSMGISSIDIIRVKQQLQERMKLEVSIMTIMTHPTIRSLAIAIRDLQKPHEYNPMVVLQSNGSKMPLWLIHPGAGEVLVFLALASYITDRPVYAIRARGFEEHEEHFANWQEAVAIYFAKIKAVQPSGPYAIAGYSYGSMIAFELTKLLNAHGDTVKFLGAFNLPPHIKIGLCQLDWANCVLHLSYFLNFFSEEYAQALHPILQPLSRNQIIEHVVSVTPVERMQTLGLDACQYGIGRTWRTRYKAQPPTTSRRAWQTA